MPRDRREEDEGSQRARSRRRNVDHHGHGALDGHRGEAMSKIAKRVKKNADGIDSRKLVALTEAVKMVKARANAKFDETVEIALNLGVDPKYPDQQVRGV